MLSQKEIEQVWKRVFKTKWERFMDLLIKQKTVKQQALLLKIAKEKEVLTINRMILEPYLVNWANKHWKLFSSTKWNNKEKEFKRIIHWYKRIGQLDEICESI